MFLIVLSLVILGAATMPASFPVQNIDVANLEIVKNASRATPAQPWATGLAGFGAETIGGRGGAVWTVFDPWALRDAVNSPEPRIVVVRGCIDLTLLFVGSPGVIIQVGPFKTIYGGDRDAEITGGSLYLLYQRHVIFQNIKFSNAISYAPGEQPDGNGGIVAQQPGGYIQIDNIDINLSEHVWVDHCEFSDDPWTEPEVTDDTRRHRGLITIKQSSNLITISNSIFRNHNMNNLIGHDDSYTQDVGRLKVTLYLNWFRGTVQRNPMVRYGEVHVFNNLYTDIKSYGIGVYTDGQVYAENNVFINTRRAWADPILNQPAENRHIKLVNNLLINSTFDAGMTSDVDWNPSSYYDYNPISVGEVEDHVRMYAGPI